MLLHFCSICGNTETVFMYKPGEKYYCSKCGRMIYPVMNEYLDPNYKGSFKSDEAEEEFKQRYIYKSKDYQKTVEREKDYANDPKERDIDNFLKARQMARDGKVFRSENKKIVAKQTYTPKCPTCGSPNISSIGTVERAGSVAMFGLASKKIGKTFKCSNCGYTW